MWIHMWNVCLFAYLNDKSSRLRVDWDGRNSIQVDLENRLFCTVVGNINSSCFPSANSSQSSAFLSAWERRLSCENWGSEGTQTSSAKSDIDRRSWIVGFEGQKQASCLFSSRIGCLALWNNKLQSVDFFTVKQYEKDFFKRKMKFCAKEFLLIGVKKALKSTTSRCGSAQPSPAGFLL